MNKMINKSLNNNTNRLESTPIINIERVARRTPTVRSLKEKRRQDKVYVSCQDIRDLATTLYLKEIPGLGGIEADRDRLIDNYYNPGLITD